MGECAMNDFFDFLPAPAIQAFTTLELLDG
jgi:hypothetical protein